MNRSRAIPLSLAVALIAAPAWAVKVGDTLYIRSKDTKVVKTATATGAQVVVLQPGAEVIWNGVDDKDKHFHKIKAGAKEGFVLLVNLSPSKVAVETNSDGKEVKLGAVANSAAAGRSASESAQLLAIKKPELGVACQQVVLLELITAAVTDKDVAAHAAKQGLPKAGGK